MKIKAEKPIIDEAVLDLMGKEFKFDHAKGIAEWFKNSVDAYNLEETPDDEQIIYLFLSVSKNTHIKAISVIDFVGMSKEKIDVAFKRWFDPQAARKMDKSQKKNIKTLGGHGNGGKFYMREMFKTSSLITYRDNRLNGFGFDEHKQYGFYSELDNIMIDINNAIERVGFYIYHPLPDEVRKQILRRQRFTIVTGFIPKSAHKTNYVGELLNKLIIHPQARRIIQHKKVYLISGNNMPSKKLIIPQLVPKKGFNVPYEFICPQFLHFENRKIKMYDSSPIRLVLFTSEEPLKGSKYKGMNSIDFLGDVGVIANYEMNEIGHFRSYVYSEFIYGECYAQVMEDEGYVTNDREKFIKSDKSQALLNWVKESVESLCENMERIAKKEAKKQNLQKTSELNELLNIWKNRFLQKVVRERLAGIGEKFGMEGDKEEKWSVTPETTRKKKSNSPKKSGNYGGDKKKRGAFFPEVRISGMDPDPFSNSNEPFYCDPRQPAVYQRPIDFQYGIYWINTSKKFAELILEKYGPDSIRWREYLFQRYVDIIVREALYALSKTNVDLTSDSVLNEIDRITSEVLDLAAEDLESFLFDRNFKS